MNLEKEINIIKERNKRVELDKSWETSWTRRICIMILTYIIVVIYSYIINQTTLYNTLYVGDKQDILTFKYDDNIYKNKKLSLGQFLFPDELIYKERKYYNKNEYIYTTLYVNSEEELENIINNNKTISIKKTYPYKIENLDTSKDLIRQYVWKYFKAPGYVDIEYNLKYYTYVIREEK